MVTPGFTRRRGSAHWEDPNDPPGFIRGTQPDTPPSLAHERGIFFACQAAGARRETKHLGEKPEFLHQHQARWTENGGL